MANPDAWIETYTGRRFWPLAPRPEDVRIEDIAHALAHQCRYNGHCRRFYSVAEHSVLVARAVDLEGAPPSEVLLALLHDAAEAYLPDVQRPIKALLPGFAEVERRVERAIAEALGLPDLDKTPLVQEMDARIVVDEIAAVMGPDSLDAARQRWAGTGLGVDALAPAQAELRFLEMYRVYRYLLWGLPPGRPQPTVSLETLREGGAPNAHA